MYWLLPTEIISMVSFNGFSFSECVKHVPFREISYYKITQEIKEA